MLNKINSDYFWYHDSQMSKLNIGKAEGHQVTEFPMLEKTNIYSATLQKEHVLILGGYAFIYTENIGLNGNVYAKSTPSTSNLLLHLPVLLSRSLFLPSSSCICWWYLKTMTTYLPQWFWTYYMLSFKPDCFKWPNINSTWSLLQKHKRWLLTKNPISISSTLSSNGLDFLYCVSVQNPEIEELLTLFKRSELKYSVISTLSLTLTLSFSHTQRIDVTTYSILVPSFQIAFHILKRGTSLFYS